MPEQPETVLHVASKTQKQPYHNPQYNAAYFIDVSLVTQCLSVSEI